MIDCTVYIAVLNIMITMHLVLSPILGCTALRNASYGVHDIASDKSTIGSGHRTDTPLVISSYKMIDGGKIVMRSTSWNSQLTLLDLYTAVITTGKYIQFNQLIVYVLKTNINRTKKQETQRLQHSKASKQGQKRRTTMSYEITTNPSLSPSTKTPILNFLSTFYQTSDTESLHDKYVASFTEDATLIMGSKKAVGSDGTLLQHIPT